MALAATVRRWLGGSAAEAFILQESPGAPVAVWECNAWHGFIVEVLYPTAVRIPVAPGDAASRLLDAVPHAARGVLVNLNLSLTRGFIRDDVGLAAALAQRKQRALNLAAVDVRKATLHACCRGLGIPSARAERDGPPTEQLILKTTLNYGGDPERELRTQWGEGASAFVGDVSDSLRHHGEYVVTARARIPAAAWSDPAVVVERFIENPEGLFFRVYLAGPAGVVCTVWIDGQIKKLSTRIRRRVNSYYWTLATGEAVPLGPSSDRAERALNVTRRVGQGLNIDFLGADCVMDSDGNVTIVDVNKTPYWGQPRQSPILSHLRHGFNALIGHAT